MDASGLLDCGWSLDCKRTQIDVCLRTSNINQQEAADVKKAYVKPSITALGLLRSVTNAVRTIIG
jgi:hypothetical protein